MRTRYRIFLILFIAVLSCTLVRAQQHYTKSNGLLSNTVYNSFRDSKGYIWFGTDKGACRFDGRNFKNYTTLDGLPDNSVLSFFEDRLGRLWLFCYNGASCFIYDGNIYTASNSRLLTKLPTVSYQRCMCNGKDSTLYIAYSIGPIIKLNFRDSSITYLKQEYPYPSFVSLQYWHDTLIAYDQSHGISKYYKDKQISFTPVALSYAFYNKDLNFRVFENKTEIYKNAQLVAQLNNLSIRMPSIIKIAPYNDHSFFACDHNGLLLIDYINKTEKWLIKDIKTTSISRDISGNYWVATLSNGIYQLSSELNNAIPLTTIEQDEIIQKGDHLYRTTRDSLYIFDPLTLRQTALKTKYNTSWSVLIDNKDHVIVNINNNTSLISKSNGKIFTKVFPLAFDNTNPVFSDCIPYSDDKYFFTSSISYVFTNIKNNRAENIYDRFLPIKMLGVKQCSANKHFYILTTKNLLEVDTTGTERIIDSFNSFTPLNAYCFNNHIFITSADKLVLYTLGTKKRIFYNFNGLGISNIIQIFKDRFIIATNKGYRLLVITDEPGNHIYTESISYPFNGTEIYNTYTCGTNLLMAVNNNLYKVDPSLINTRSTRPVFFIDSVLVNNKNDTSHHIVITNKTSSNISVSLSALYFGNPNISYQYRFIKGHDKGQWLHSDGGQLNLFLPSYGDYTIEFAAVADNNNTSASQFLYVSWPPPFYLTWWFFAILGLLFIALVIYMVYLNNQRRKLKFNREMDMLQLEHKAINSLLNPHFVFNAINNIQNLVNKYRVDDANEYLARLSRLIRQNIENLQFNLITAEKELSLVRNYIYLQNLRFADKIHLQINNTADADKLYLPPLLIHTFVENSVVHGFSPDIKDFTITIDIQPDGKDYVDIAITDNGLGLNKPTQAQQALKDKTSIGVDATRRRLQKLSEFYKVDYKLDITDRQATDGVPGAKVSIRFYAHFGNLLPVN